MTPVGLEFSITSHGYISQMNHSLLIFDCYNLSQIAIYLLHRLSAWEYLCGFQLNLKLQLSMSRMSPLETPKIHREPIESP